MLETETNASRALVLFSGGLDSTTCLAIATQTYKKCYALSFSYGQRHSAELEAAKIIADRYGVSHHITTIDPHFFLNTSLVENETSPPVPKNTNESDTSIPSTYVPARNTLFLAYALAFAESYAIGNIYIGVNAIDYSGYPDCRPAFIHAFQNLASVATKSAVEGNPVRIHTPLLNCSKQEIVALGVSLGVSYGETISCYDPTSEGLACGECDACRLRREGFTAAGISDPTRYSS